MGHVYSILVKGDSDSNAMPQVGQGPGLDWRTLGHIGQTNCPVSELGVVSGGVDELGVDAFDAVAPMLTNGRRADFGFKY